MKTITQEELTEILRLHKLWLKGDNKGIRADLSYANLSYANLSDAILSGAILSGANLSGADLRYCTGNNMEVKSLQLGTYLISYTSDKINIGCQTHTLERWKSFSNEEISKFDSDALVWWKKYKDIIINIVELS